MRGPRIRKLAYVPEAERSVRNDLVRVLTATTASFYPADAQGDAMHAERWRVRIRRTRDLGKLRYTPKGVHLANNHPVKWRADQPTRWPRLPDVLSAVRDAGHDVTTTWETFFARGVLPESWVGEGARRFWCNTCEGTGDRNGWYNGCAACEDKGALTMPPSLAWAISLTAGGAEPLVRAEALAREAVARLYAFGLEPRPRRVVWKVGKVDTAHAPKPIADIPWEHNGNWRTWEAAWKKALNEDQRGAWWRAHVEVWKRKEPCPHEPVLEMLRLGFMLDVIDIDTLVLVCPLIGGTHG